VCVLCVRERESVYGSDVGGEMSAEGVSLYLLRLYRVCVCACFVCERESFCAWK